MKRIRLVGRFAVYFCVAVVLAEAVALLTLWQRGAIDRRKALGLLTVAYDIDVNSLRAPSPSSSRMTEDATPSGEEIAQARTLARLDWELRSGGAANTLSDLQRAQKTVAERQRKLAELRTWYAAEADRLRNADADSELAEVQQTLIAVRPAQAKDQLQRMWSAATGDQPESLNDVLTIIKSTGLANRKRIFAEFKSPADQEQLAEMLRHLRHGDPLASVAQQARTKLAEITGDQLQEPKHDVAAR